MKEIDLLPQWYKNGRRQRVGYRKQGVVLGCIFLIMMVWHISDVHNVSTTAASVESMETRLAESDKVLSEFAEIEAEVAELKNKQKVLDAISSRIDVAEVLAEISFLVGGNIVLSNVEFKAEKFDGKDTSKGGSIVRSASADKSNALPDDVRFKILIRGIAADSGNVAELICRLEDSPYFCQVCPSYSKNSKLKADSDYQASEFEIVSYLANYRIEKGN